MIDQNATPSDWKPTQRRQKDTDAIWTNKHGKCYFRYTLSVNLDKSHKLIRKIVTCTASTRKPFHLGTTRQAAYADRGYSTARGLAEVERMPLADSPRKGTEARTTVQVSATNVERAMRPSPAVREIAERNTNRQRLDSFLQIPTPSSGIGNKIPTQVLNLAMLPVQSRLSYYAFA